VNSIQEVNDHFHTVLGTHWNTLYPDCIRNIHAVNGCGYTVLGTHLNALRHCFQPLPRKQNKINKYILSCVCQSFSLGWGLRRGLIPPKEKKIKTQLRCELHYRAFM